MRKLLIGAAGVMLALALTVTATGAPQAEADQGRRLAGPFCIGKTFLKPLEGGRSTREIRFQLAILRAGRCDRSHGRSRAVPGRTGNWDWPGPPGHRHWPGWPGWCNRPARSCWCEG